MDKGRISPGLSRHRLHVWLRPSLVASFRWRQKTEDWQAIAGLVAAAAVTSLAIHTAVHVGRATMFVSL